MNNYFENPLYRKAFLEDTDRIMAGFQKDFLILKSGEAPHGKPRDILARLGGASLAELGQAGEAWAEPCEAKNAILSSMVASATEDLPCGKPQGFLAKKGENKKDALKNIHRYAHSLKGLSAMMELADISSIAENLESVLAKTLKENVFDLDADKTSKIGDDFKKIECLLKIIKDNLIG